MFDKLKKNILIVIGFATFIYFVFLIYADYELVLSTIYNFPISKFIFILFLIICSLILKFIRWHSYIKKLHIKISFGDSFLIFMAGLIMSISPGKVGELLKSYLIKNKYQISMSKTASIVIAERIVEFIALIILALSGAVFYNFGYEYLVAVAIVIILLFLLILNRNFISIVQSIISRIPFLSSKIENLTNFQTSLALLFSPSLFFRMLTISFAAWLLECFGFYIILSNFVLDAEVLWSSFVYSIAIIFGAITLLPGGIGTTEGSLTYLLSLQGISQYIALSSTILIRIVTLWFSVLIGFISYLFFLKLIKNNDV